ncbi:MAG: hypothetical protein WBF48_14480 [Halarcobacter sp.]
MKKLVYLLCLGFAFNLFADSYVIEESKIFEIKTSTALATISKGTKVNVLKTKGTYSLVELKGWSYEEEPNDKLFFKEGVTVHLAKLEGKGIKLRKILQTKEDKYEEVWIENSIKGWIQTKKLTSDFSRLWKKEKEFVSLRCSGCHEAPKAESHFAGEFPSIIDSMAEQAGLTQKDEDFIVNYLQKSNIYKH